MIKFHGAACAQVRQKQRCFWGKKAASKASGARRANKLWLWVRSAAGSTSWMNSLSHYWQVPLLGKFLFPVTSSLSAPEELSYQILNSPSGSGLKHCLPPRHRRTNEPNGSCSSNKFKKYWTKSCICNHPQKEPHLCCPTKNQDIWKAKSAQQ